MSYIKQTWSDGEVITSRKLNYLENGVQSLSENVDDKYREYDLVIETTGDSDLTQLSSYTITRGNMLDCEDLLVSTTVVKGLLIVRNNWNDYPSGANIREVAEFYPLTCFYGPYTYVSFGGVRYSQSTNNGSIQLTSFKFVYDKDTGELTRVNYSNKSVS